MSQLNLFETEELKESTSYRGGSHASRTALQESVYRLVMSVTCGPNTNVSLARLNQDGLWLKMYGDCFQVRMDGSFEEYSETLPGWGLMWDGSLIPLHGLVPYIDEREYLLLPTPTASDGEAWVKVNRTNVTQSLRKNLTIPKGRRGLMQKRLSYFIQVNGHSILKAASIYEMIMGFPKGYTDLHV